MVEQAQILPVHTGKYSWGEKRYPAILLNLGNLSSLGICLSQVRERRSPLSGVYHKLRSEEVALRN